MCRVRYSERVASACPLTLPSPPMGERDEGLLDGERLRRA